MLGGTSWFDSLWNKLIELITIPYFNIDIKRKSIVFQFKIMRLFIDEQPHFFSNKPEGMVMRTAPPSRPTNRPLSWSFSTLTLIPKSPPSRSIFKLL